MSSSHCQFCVGILRHYYLLSSLACCQPIQASSGVGLGLIGLLMCQRSRRKSTVAPSEFAVPSSSPSFLPTNTAGGSLARGGGGRRRAPGAGRTRGGGRGSPWRSSYLLFFVRSNKLGSLQYRDQIVSKDGRGPRKRGRVADQCCKGQEQ